MNSAEQILKHWQGTHWKAVWLLKILPQKPTRKFHLLTRRLLGGLGVDLKNIHSFTADTKPRRHRPSFIWQTLLVKCLTTNTTFLRMGDVYAITRWRRGVDWKAAAGLMPAVGEECHTGRCGMQRRQSPASTVGRPHGKCWWMAHPIRAETGWLPI